MTALRPSIFYLHPLLMGRVQGWDAHFARAAACGFDTVAFAPPFAPGRCGDLFLTGDHVSLHPVLEARDAVAGISAAAARARAHGLTLILDLVADRLAEDAVLARERPDWFEPAPARDLPDPRIPPETTHAARFRPDALCGAAAEWWVGEIATWLDAGIGGLRCVAAHRAPPAFWRTLIPRLRPRASLLIADIIGATDAEAAELRGCGFDFAASASCFWDFHAAWIADDERRVAAVGAPLAMPEPPFGQRSSANLANHGLARRAAERAARFAAGHGAAWLMPMGFEYGASRPLDPIRDRPDVYERLRAAPAYDLCDLLAEINGARRQQAREAARLVSAPGDRVSVLLQGAPGPHCCLVAVNTSLDAPALLDPARLPADGRAAYTIYAAAEDKVPDAIEMPPAGVVILAPRARPAIRLDRTEDVTQATQAPRIAIEIVSPAVDNGRFAVKRAVGDIVTVDADIICDGHDRLGVTLLWRCADEDHWRRVRMLDLGNDRWRAAFPLTRLGRHIFTVEAWRDAFATYSHELHAKHAAGVAIGVELEEGFRLLRRAVDHAPAETRAEHAALADRIAAASPEERRAVLFDPRTAELMALADDQPFGVRLAPGIPLDAERPEAGFASWYELFPRSMTNDPARHGTFRDVIGRLPAIRDMGFDVLYFPPIHPIGRANRKGRNNSLTPAPDDPGSPYAIGADAGGHDAIHPELGTLDDFRALRDAATAHGLELALDFAIQCSPDHPWLRAHPDWFAWRADGSLRYAENPPKKYEDIVNVDFYAPGAIPALWEALRDVVLFWVAEGVLMFRVDNPHTKPLSFWEWLIGEVRAKHPEAMFLAEAFTKPKMMHRLAKVGFSQSYTYFTWRNTKAELRTYLEELNEAPVRDFFRPHFFVNTPDINPVFLQHSGRAGFLIRAALAATLAGLWGLYSGFELCEAAALPGREEYLDSEKYQIRVWDWNRPGNIIAEITRLNRIRRANPALQTHLGVTFLNALNDNILYFEKASPGRANVVLVAVNLDPYAAQEADIELPLWRWSLPDDANLYAEDLMGDRGFVWQGKRQHIRLDPAGLPFAIWRVRPDTGA